MRCRADERPRFGPRDTEEVHFACPHYFRLALEPVQLLYLLGVYLLLGLPFFFSGAVIAMAYVAYPLSPGAVYFASMTGSALGAMAPLALLAIIGEAALVALSALAAPIMLLVGVPAFFRREASGRSKLRSARAIVAGWMLVCFASLWMLTPAAAYRLAIKPSEFKFLSQVLQYPNTRVAESISGIRGPDRTRAEPAPALCARPQPEAHRAPAAGRGAVHRHDLVSSYAIASQGNSAEPPQVTPYEIAAPQDEKQALQLAQSGFHLLVSVPLSTKGHTLGLFLLGKRERSRLSPEELSLLSSIGQQIGVAMENAHLDEQAEQTAVAAERNRLARELHDAVTQTLFSANLIADVIPRIWRRDPDEGLQNLEELRQLTRGALAEMRTMLLEMRPESLERSEIKSLLTQLTDAFIGRVRVPVSLVIQGDCELTNDHSILTNVQDFVVTVKRGLMRKDRGARR